MARTWTMRNKLAALLVLLLPVAAAADQAIPDEPQGPAKVRFAEDFPRLTDHQWGLALLRAPAASRISAPWH